MSLTTIIIVALVVVIAALITFVVALTKTTGSIFEWLLKGFTK